jgi:hypothetical protein
MRVNFPKLFCLVLLLPIFCEAQASDVGGESLASCKESLKSKAVAFGQMVGVSVYRMFNKYPPVGAREVQLEQVYSVLKEKVKSVDISPGCLREQLLSSAQKYYDDGLVKVTNADVVPVRVYSAEKGYLLVFLYPGYLELDGTGEEVSAGVASYGTDGRLLGVIERVATWANNEGTLNLRESCVTDMNITTSEKHVGPFERREDGEVILYDPPFEEERVIKGIFGNTYSSVGGYECSAGSYIKLNKK